MPPETSPVTTPLVLIVATVVLVLLQVPPVVASVMVIGVPAQIAVAPDIALTVGTTFTVTTKVAVDVPHVPVTV